MVMVELRSIEHEMDVVVEMNSLNNIELRIEDSEEKIEDTVDFFCKTLANLVSKIGFEVVIEMAKVANERVFSNYFEIVVHNPEIVHKDIASLMRLPWSSWSLIHSIILLVNYL